MAPPLGRPQTSWNNGRYIRYWLQNRRKLICMKGRSVSLGVDVSHVKLPIATSETYLGNAH